MRAGPIVAALWLAGIATTAHANDGTSTDVPPGPPLPPDKDIEIEQPGTRTTLNTVTLAVAAGLGVVGGGIGLYENLQARTHANDLSGDGMPAATWTAARASELHDIHRDNVGAAVGYSIGGALIVGAAVGFILTQPATHTVVIHPLLRHASVAPTRGGGLVGTSWSF